MQYYEFAYNGNVYHFERDEADKDKYIVFACAKNEDNYILEWVDHYLSLGFDKVIIADNNDSPESLREILSEYIAKGTVQIFECNGLKKFQLYIYNMFLAEGNYKWCAYFDCDEFLELNAHKDIKDFLSCVNEECVLINWVVFGSNSKTYKEEGTVQERFKEPVTPLPFFKENFYVKPIILGGAKGFYLTNTHCPSANRKMFNIGGYYYTSTVSHVYYPPRCKYAYIKHYYTKSFEEWASNKVKRGWPDEMFNILKPSNYFIVDQNQRPDITRFINGFFVDNNEFSEKRIKELYGKDLDKYEVIVLRSSTNNMYSMTLHLYSFMTYYTNHIFVIDNKQVDDALFDSFLEYAMITGNRVAFAFSQKDIDRVLLNKTTWNKSLYYYMDLQ